MNREPAWAQASTFHDLQSKTAPPFTVVTKTVTTIFLLTLGYYVLNFLDVWPSTFQRSLYEIFIYLIPSHFIYALQLAMTRFARVSDDAPTFKRADFGNQQAKAEAMHRMLGQSPLPSVLRKAKSLSGLERMIPQSTEPGPPGLGNWDNSCYQNSVLQGLASLPAFQDYVEKSLKICDKLNVSASTHRALKLFLHQLSDTMRPKATLWTPSVLKSMDSWQQQDAQEYFSRMLEVLEKEDLKAVQNLKRHARIGLAGLVRSSEEEESSTLLRQVSLGDPKSDKNELGTSNQTICSPNTKRRLEPDFRASLALLRSPMDGMLAQALECQSCGFSEGYSLTQFNCLTLNMGLNGNIYLEDLLDEYTEPEEVEGVECTACTKALADGVEAADDQDAPSPTKRPKLKPVLRTKAKQITVGRLPKSLVIHINRSIFDEYGNQRKNGSLVRFPSKLKFLNTWCAPLGKDDDEIQSYYELKCSVTHYGRHENGHYVAFGKRGKEWYCFNDDIVTQMTDEEDVLSRGNVFMLFYEAIDLPPAVKREPESMPGDPRTHDVVTTSEASTVLQPVLQPVQQTASKQESPSESSSGSEPDTVVAVETEPAKPVAVMRTSSGKIKIPAKNAVVSTPVVSAL